MSGTGDRRRRSAQHYGEVRPDQVHLQAGLETLTRAGGFTQASITVLDADGGHNLLARVDHLLAGESGAHADLVDEIVRTGRPARSPTNTHLGVPLVGRESLVIGALCAVHSRPEADATRSLAVLVHFGLVVQDQLDLIRRLGSAAARPATGSEFAPADLIAAIDAGQIVPWYQPIIDLGSGRTIGYEALARWVRPSGEVVVPARFIPLAEDSDVILDLDRAVVGRALADLRRWQRSDPELRMSVNLSGRHFDFDEGADAVRAMVEDADVSPALVDLELTETARLRAGAEVGVLTRTLRQSGFRVWLDDFGTGWSSLENLLQLAVDGLKIDRAFVAVDDDQVGPTLARAIVTMATDLGLAIAIEGIETRTQADLARQLGCHFAQGFFWSPAVPGGAVQPG